MVRLVIWIVIVLCFVLNNCLKFVNPDSIDSINSPTWKSLLEIVHNNDLRISIFLGFVLAGGSYATSIFWPGRKMKEIQNNIIRQMYSELLEVNSKYNRVTLFREVNYVKATWRHIYAIFYHLLHYRQKARMYFHPLRWGRYLVIDNRAGLPWQKTTTMFRVEESNEKTCEGVVGQIRYQRSSVLVKDLPDIGNLDLNRVDVMRGKAIEVKSARAYMRGSRINLRGLKKLHSRARHYYGTILVDNYGKIWGVLVADSAEGVCPFDTDTFRKRFDSFALTLCNLNCR